MRKLPSETLVVLALLVLITSAAFGQIYTPLRDLGTQSGDPINPAWIGAFTQGRDGNLYSTTQGGGDHALGAVFKLTPSGTMTKLYSFNNGDDGAFPNGGLTLGTDGSLYGTAVAGGLVYGTIFKITTSGTLKPLHSFNGNTEGEQPYAAPVQARTGTTTALRATGVLISVRYTE